VRGAFSAVWYVCAHGIAFLSWIALLIAQATFILKRRVSLHREMGTAGAVLAVLMLISGVAVAVMSTQRDRCLAAHRPFIGIAGRLAGWR
jgi:hypothetical protein